MSEHELSLSDNELALMSKLPPWILLAVAVLVLLAYALPRIAEASASLAKLMGPIGRYWRQRGLIRAEERDAELQKEAKELAKQIVGEVTPPDYAEMGRRLGNLTRRVVSLEESDQIQRAFIVYDEEWHFNDALSAVGRPDCAPAPRMNHNQFKQFWRDGWRPGDPVPDD